MQWLRAIAALLVVEFHVNLVISLSRYWPGAWNVAVFQMGHAGVEVFFVLSGFIIFSAHGGDIGRQDRFGRYLYRRIVRIYPAYWVILAIVLLSSFVLPQSESIQARNFGHLLSSILLVPLDPLSFQRGSSVLIVAWTLYHEIMFYALFSLMILNRRIGVTLMGLWFIGSVVAMVFPSSPSLWDVYFAPLHLLFGFGMLISWIYNKSVIRTPAGACLVGLLVFFIVAASELNYPAFLSPVMRSIGYGLGAALMILGLANWERAGGRVGWGWLVFLGDASYSIYLVHHPALLAVSMVVRRLQMSSILSGPVCFLFLTISAVTAGVLFHLAVEKPLLSALQRRGRTKLAIPSTPAPA